MKTISNLAFIGFFHILVLSFATVRAQNNQNQVKSAITIDYPSNTTVWKIPELVELRWNTKNMDTTQSIRFFLARNEMVVQELGRFKNNGYANGIKLAKNINSGDAYQVVGIELFPNNKYHIAKFATSFFSIVNKESDDRKRKQELANIVTQPGKRRKKKNTKEKKNIQLSETKVASKMENNLRQEFDGRKISYIKELEFDTEKITVKIWDHGIQDGDIVSIYLNGSPVVSKHYLTYQMREFDIKLDPEKPNDLFLYAHNLGDAPPNTVSAEITNGKKSNKIVLNSDLKSCEAVLISVKK